MKKLNLLLLILILGITSCKKETDTEQDIQPNHIESELILNEISGPSITEINQRDYSSSQAADFFSMDFISSSSESVSAQARNEVNPFLLKANEALYNNTSEEQIELLIESIGYPAWDIGEILGIYQEHGVESVYIPTFESDKKTIKSLMRFFFAKDESVSFSIYDAKLYSLIYSQHPNDSRAIHINSLFYFFSNQQELAAKERGCAEGNCHWVDLSNGRFCVWVNGNAGGYTSCDPECCNGIELDQGNQDLGNWFNNGTLVNPFIQIRGNTNPGGGNNTTDPISQIINSSDEQAIIAFLMERFGWDATDPNTLSIVTYPNYMQAILQHLRIDGNSETSIQSFIDFMNDHGSLTELSTAELTTLINLLPQGRGIINLGVLDNYLKSNNTDVISVFILHEILRLVINNPELVYAAPSILDDFYRALTPEVMTWIEGSDDNFRRFLNLFLINGPSEEAEERRNNVTEVLNMQVEHNLEFNSTAVIFLVNNTIHKDQIQAFIANHSGTNKIEAAREFANEHGNRLSYDIEYVAFIESTAGFTPVMWSIAKELIGDKVIDIILRFIPGFGQSENLKDAIKAISHGDPLEFLFEAGQLVVGNTPLVQLLKGWDAVDELHDLYKKVERIWDKIGSFTEEAIDQMWTIVKRYPKVLWTNSDLMGSIAKAIHRGIKSIDEVMASIPGFTQMSSQRMRHILHGDAGGGLHHASGLVNNPTLEVLEHFAPNAKGVYKIRYELPNGETKLSTMFPDNKSEIGVAKSIENVFNNPTQSDLIENGTKRLIQGIDSGGIPIEIITDFNYNIITAFPKFN